MLDVYYEEELKAFNKNRIKYLVVGGLAVNLHGLKRFTQDLDLMIDLTVSKKSLEKIIRVMEGMGYYTRVPKSKWNKIVAITYVNKEDNSKIIDIFLQNPIDFWKAYKKRTVFRAKGFSVSCISFDDLIAMKEKTERVRDLIDVGGLRKMREEKKR